MKILSMTATFGKLEHQTLTLEPGLNVITAPNEWGKSTWCAFLVAMLYGVETRAKSTRTTLADKERYAPWSGSPMSGRMEILWQGKNITIERRTKGRVPLGEFRAYETESGLPVPELTGANCGQILLGVERSVFSRAGLIRLSDLPVTRDEALLSRLNALVTTGDESGDGERLAKGLKELKNRCRYNRSGLLPQAEGEKTTLEAQLREMDALIQQQKILEQRLEETARQEAQLKNHLAALAYDEARADARRVENARRETEEILRRESAAQQRCEGLPDREQAVWACGKLEELDRERMALEGEAARLAAPGEMPQPPVAFRGMTAAEAVSAARADGQHYRGLEKSGPFLPVMGVLGVACVALFALKYWLLGAVCAAAMVAVLAFSAVASARRKKARKALEMRYSAQDPDLWLREAENYADAMEHWQAVQNEYQTLRRELEQRRQILEEKIRRCTQEQPLYESVTQWRKILAEWDALADAQREAQRARAHLQTLESMARPVPQPVSPTELTCSREEAERRLQALSLERQQALSRLHQYRGRLESIGDRDGLETALEKTRQRIRQLKNIYRAAELAQKTLEEASAELQRRFAPQIAQRAQEHMARMTGGRYTRLSLGEGLALRAGTQEEDTLRDALWRSDGTADQLYLALRLAVAEALTPDAPLILDDALARFDDGRMEKAMDLLAEEAASRQVIVFSCQSREKELMNQ